MLTVILITAYITADREALFSIFSDPDKFMASAPFTFLFASLLILIFGPGKIAVDTLLGRCVSAPADPAVGPAPSSTPERPLLTRGWFLRASPRTGYRLNLRSCVPIAIPLLLF